MHSAGDQMQHLTDRKGVLDRLPELLAEIRRHPDDMSRRDLLAAFLIERGDPRSEWIQIQCANELLEPKGTWQHWIAEFTQFELDDNDRREAELLESFGSQWFDNPPSCLEVTPRRGLFEVQLSEELTGQLDVAACWLRRQQPWIEKLSISIDDEKVLLFLADQGLLGQIATFHLHTNCELSPIAFERLSQLDQLRSLSINGDAFTDESFKHLAHLGSLQSLELLGLQYFHGSGLHAIATLAELRKLRVVLGGEFTHLSGLSALRSLEHLTIQFSYSRDNPQLCDRICEAIQAIHSLTTLQLSGTGGQGATNVGLRALSELKNLKSLTLEHASDADLGILASLPQLRELSLGGGATTDAQLKQVAQLKLLRHFAVWLTRISGVGLSHLSALEHLRTLTIPQLNTLCPQLSQFAGRHVPTYLELFGNEVTDDGIKHLLQLSQLTAIDLRNTAVTSQGLETLSQLPRLESLNLGLNQLVGLHPDIVGRWTSLRKLSVWGRGGLRPLSLFSVLSELSIALELQHGNFDEEELAFLSEMLQIKLLDISNTTSITNDGLRHLSSLTQLQQLLLGESEITEEGLRFLSEMRQLRELALSEIPLDGDGLQNLHGMKKLLNLKLNHTGVTDAGMPHLAHLSQLEYLDLYRSKLTDSGLAHLTSLRRLTSLNLSHSQVSDAGVAHLIQMPSLRHLWINQTEITETGYQMLQRALPQCSCRYSFNDD